MTNIDTYGRKINYLRLSVTDLCNLRCSYCMPAQGVKKHAHKDILSYEQFHRIAEASVAIGVEKIRITGGEPLVRNGIIGFLAGLKQIPGLKKLVLTTNGVFLGEMAGELRSAGVESVNISLDSLRPEVFFRITRGGDLNRVFAGIAAAEQTGFKHLKINMVVMRGVNDDEVLDFAALTINKPFNVRFIEYMPTLKEKNWQSLMVPGDELISRLSEQYQLTKVTYEALDGPAVNYQIQGAVGKIGFITPISSHFCQDCNRIRVTSSGTVKSCLFDDGKMSLKPYLENGDDASLQEALLKVAKMKPHRHALMSGEADNHLFNMSQIGG
ncbi:MAG: GTP 3',8-cyclase MoaA [Desulfuromonadaceae bacterium]|nr:GTP 3',8-cyclase MoaA [Desulfuromonadaceae bacterium]